MFLPKDVTYRQRIGETRHENQCGCPNWLILFSCGVTHESKIWCAPLIVWLALIVYDVALVLCASSFVQKLLFGWQRSCCFIHCMSLDRSLQTRRISLIKPSLGHIRGLLFTVSFFKNFIGSFHFLLEGQKKCYPILNSGRKISYLLPRTKHYIEISPFIYVPDFVMFMFVLMVCRRLVCF